MKTGKSQCVCKEWERVTGCRTPEEAERGLLKLVIEINNLKKVVDQL